MTWRAMSPGPCVEVNFAYTHKFSERLLDKLLRLSENVTRVETGVILANNLVSGLDNTSPKAGGLLRTSTRPTLNQRTESARMYEHSLDLGSSACSD